MQFLWFDWDDPKASIIWSGLITLMGVILLIPWWPVLLGWGIIPLPKFLWNVSALGLPVTLVGLLTLGLSAVAWLSSKHRQ